MERLSTPTGGRVFAMSSIDELSGAFDTLLDELSHQYLLGYPPPGDTRDGKFHEIRVRVDGHKNVRARQWLPVHRTAMTMGISYARLRHAGSSSSPSVLGARARLPRRRAGSAPRFRSGVDVTSVDVTVVDDRGRPILGLEARRLHASASTAARGG